MGCRGFSHFVLNILTFENKLQFTGQCRSFTGPALIAVFFLKLKQQSCINMFKLLLLSEGDFVILKAES